MWSAHDAALRRVVDFLAEKEIRAIRLVDTLVDREGKPRTDLTVGLTDKPVWMGVVVQTPDGTVFFPNMPTEEVFTTPHNRRTNGWQHIQAGLPI